MYLVVFTALYASGIALGSTFGPSPALLCGLVAGLLLAVRARRTWAVPLLGALAAGIPSGRAIDRPVTPRTKEARVLEGCLIQPVERARGRSQLLLALHGGSRLRVTVRAGPVSLAPGDCVRLRAKVGGPVGLANPDKEAGARFAAAHEIHLFATVMHARELVRMSHHEAAPLWGLADAARTSIARTLLEARPPGDARALLLALAIGDRGEISDALDAAFRSAGITHLLSVSGLHLAVAAFLIFAGLRRLLLRWPALAERIEARRVAAGASIPAVWAYALVTGLQTATCRSALMATLYFLGIALGRKSHGLAAVGAAALLLLVRNAAILFDPSFQLSFAATVGLLAIAPKVARARWMVRMSAASLAATLATLPIVAVHFFELSVAGPFCNVLLVPLCELGVLPILFGALSLAPLSLTLARPLLALCAFGAHAMGLVAHNIHRFRPTLPIAIPSALEVVLFYLLLVALLLRLRRTSIALLLLLFASLGSHPLVRRLRSELTVTFLDVGQGDAAVLELPGGTTILVDAGGSFDPSFDPGARVIEPFLRRRHIGRLDLVVLTHPHPDHMNGLPTLLERFEVGEFWECGEASDGPVAQRVRTLLAAREIRHGPARTLRIGDVLVETLAPIGGASGARSTNDNSIVLRVGFAGRSILLTGDIERDTESELVETKAPLRADILKAPHHGSRTSSTIPFLEAVQPALAVFSAGKDNLFGFPHAEVMARYRCPTFVTGHDGAVTFTINRDGAIASESMGDGLKKLQILRQP